ncbi:MAG: hypothetical protein E7224_01115 [Clostridiales bacterium]|nr:hypothetical protein [Clostridiales bacterium]
MEKKNLRDILINYCRTYPKLQLRDVFKFLHQSSFGCEHMVASLDSAIDHICREAETMASVDRPLIEELAGDYSRVHLSWLKKGLSPETLGKLFYLSARTEEFGREALEEKLAVVREMVFLSEISFSAEEFDLAVTEWKEQGYPAIHHSEAFREAYHPAYRVIADEYIPFLPLFAKLDAMLAGGAVKLAIEGGSASGKSTLSALLEKLYDCTVFHMDDFFLQPHQRTPQRFAEAGGNVDRERFREEVLIPLSQGDEVSLKRFNCSTQTIEGPERIQPKKLTVIEGAYSMHPELAGYYDLSVFLDIDPAYQKTRILKRNTLEFAQRFFDEWIPLEQRYFEAFNIPASCSLSVEISPKKVDNRKDM